MNALIDMAEARYEEFFGSDRHIGKLPESKEDFIQTAIQKVSFTMRDPMIRKMRKFLVREQFRNERFAEITTKHQLGGIQGMYTKIIEGMMRNGLFKEDDPELLAHKEFAHFADYRITHCKRDLLYRRLNKFLFALRQLAKMPVRAEEFLITGFRHVDKRVQNIFFALEMIVKRRRFDPDLLRDIFHARPVIPVLRK